MSKAYVQERLAQLEAEAEKPKPAKKVPVPVFNADRPSLLLSNNTRVQGKSLFNSSGTYISEADKEYWQAELTPAQLREWQVAEARKKAKIAQLTRPLRGAPPPVPQKVLDNARENAAALRAEAHAE